MIIFAPKKILPVLKPRIRCLIISAAINMDAMTNNNKNGSSVPFSKNTQEETNIHTLKITKYIIRFLKIKIIPVTFLKAFLNLNKNLPYIHTQKVVVRQFQIQKQHFAVCTFEYSLN